MKVDDITEPDGTLRIRAEGIDMEIREEALDRAERQNGLTLEYHMTRGLHEAAVDPPDWLSPIQSETTIRLQIEPDQD